MANDPNKNADDAKKSLKDIQDITKAIEDGFRSISDALGDVVDEIKEGSKELNSFSDVTNDIEKSIKKLAKANEDLISNQSRLLSGNLSSKQVLEQMNKITAARTILQSRIASLQEEINKKGTATVEQQERLNTLTQELGSYSQEVTNQLTKQYQEAKKQEKMFGSIGNMFKAMAKIPIVGQLINANEALDAFKLKIGQGGSKIAALGSAFKEIGKGIVSNLLNPMTLVSSAIGFLTDIDKATGDLAKGMNISYDSAAKLKTSLKEVGDATKDAFINSRSLSESLIAINQSLGTSANISEEELKTFTELREKAGYTNEELAGIYKLTLATGGNLKNNVKSFAGTVQALNAQNKLTINEKQLLKDVSKVSDSIKLSVGGTAEALAKAAFKAKQFGISLEQADKMADSLLDFESSIENELSAELITGKDLNLEKARLLALNNDIAGASAEVLKQVKSSAEYGKMNRVAQEAIAKAVGLTKDELAKSLIEREALQKIGVDDAAAAQKKYEELRKTMTMEEAIKELGNDAYARQIAQTSNAEKYQALIEKLKDSFIPIAEKILPKISHIIEVIGSNTDNIKKIFVGIATIMGSIKLTGLITQLATALATSGALAATTAATASAITLGVGAIAIAAGIATIMSALSSAKASTKAEDLFSEGGYGNRTLLTPKGSIALNNEDTVIAGTNLFSGKKGDDVVSAPKGSVNVGGGMDTSKLETKLDTIANILSNIYSGEGKIAVDTDNLIKIVSMKSAYKVQ